MKIPKIYFAYFVIAILVGVIFSFGYVGTFQQKEPLQVQLEQYQPYQAPAPAVPTIAPAVQPTGEFAPAPAPQVIPTQVLPTITAEPSGDTDLCNATSQIPSTISNAFTSMGVVLFVMGVLTILCSIIGGSDSRWCSSTGSVMGGVSILIAGAIFILISSVVLNVLFSGMPCIVVN
jgi:hypothetical protein